MGTVDDLHTKLKELRLVPDCNLEVIGTLNKLVLAEHRNNPEEAEQYAKEALSLSLNLGLEKAIAESRLMYGTTCWATGDFSAALENYLYSLDIWKKLGDKRGISRACNNLGNVYRDQGSYHEALDYYLRSLKIKHEIGGGKAVAISHINIGNIHREQGLLELARDSYTQALDLFLESGDQLSIAKCYNNLGLVHSRQNHHTLALEQHKKALDIRREINDSRGIANSYGNIGTVYVGQEKYAEAMEYFKKTLEENEKLHDRRATSLSCMNIGLTYSKLNNFETAFEFIERGQNIAREIGAKDLEAMVVQHLSELCETEGDFKQALVYAREYRKIREELFNAKSLEKLASLQIRFQTESKQKENEIYQLKNVELQKECRERKNVEEELKRHRNHLEDLVHKRTTELQDVNSKLERAFKGTIFTISKIVEERDPYSSGHQIRTAELATAIAEKMGLSEGQIQAIFFAAAVHDIGKIRVPQELLSKSGKLNELEFNVVRAYPQTGYEILKPVDFPWPIADIVLQHHEYLDGSGYPSGLKGNDIKLEARILCVADTVEAMSSLRPYREAYCIEETLLELSRNKDLLYDSDVVEVCINLMQDDGFQFSEDLAVHTPNTK